MKKYSLYIFDLDGTILDTLDDLTASTNAALSMCGYPVRTKDEVRCFVGNGIRKLIERAVPEETSVEDIERVFNAFNEHYKVHCSDATKAYPGIMELLERLKREGALIAIVSNKADYAVQILCQQYFGGMYDAAAGQKEGVRKKPAPDAVNEILKILDIKRENAVYIGDSDVDIETARNSGMDCISVCWGFRDEQFLKKHGAVRLVHSPEDII